jgi:hypothetical protein
MVFATITRGELERQLYAQIIEDDRSSVGTRRAKPLLCPAYVLAFSERQWRTPERDRKGSLVSGS